jgi:tetratricopeptide (TPR) repeat protein
VESAERSFREAIAIDPKNARAQAGLGHAIRYGTDVEAAETMFLRALALDPADPLNHLDLAQYHLDYATHMFGAVELMREHLATARSHCEEAPELDDSSPEAWSILGATYLAPGEDPAKAFPHLERALSAHPSSAQILQLLAEARLARDDELGASELLMRMIAVRGDTASGQSVEEAIEQMRSRRLAQARRVGLAPKAEEPS